MLLSARNRFGMTAIFALWAVASWGCGSTYQSVWDAPEQTAELSQEASAEAEASSASNVEQGDTAWADRDNVESVRAAITAWTAAVEANPNDSDTWVKLARANFFLADGHLRFTEEEAMGESFQAGIQAAERALVVVSPTFAERMAAGERFDQAIAALEPDAVPALYWRAANLGKWARGEGFATLLGYKDEIRAVMTRCLELDRYYFFAGPDRYFGAFFAIAPAFAGGDLDRARQHFDESIRRFPNYFGTRVLLAENWATKAFDQEVFEESLNFVINGDPESMPEAGPENRVEQRKAQALIERAEEFFE